MAISQHQLDVAFDLTELGVAFDLTARSLSRAYIIDPLANYRPVKNLGYVLRRWKHIHSMAWHFGDRWSGTLLVAFRDGSLFATHYASWQTFHERFIHRPVFEGLHVSVYHDHQLLGYFTAGRSVNRGDFSHLPIDLRREIIG